nr:DUF4363 family protein [Clostridium chauvoei]
MLFILLVGGIFYLDSNFVSLCDEIMVKCEEIENSIDENDKVTAYDDAVSLLNIIQEKNAIPAIYLNHIDYDMLMNESLKLSLYIKGNDKAESLSSLHLLRYGAEHLKDLQKPNFKNIL